MNNLYWTFCFVFLVLLLATSAKSENATIKVVTPDMGTYVINKGDTLGEIAQIFNTPVEELVRLNPDINDVNRIDSGRGLKVPLHRLLKRMNVVSGIPEGKYESLVIELPAGMMELPPALVASMVKESLPLIMETMPKESTFNEASLVQLEKTINASLTNLVASFPKEIDVSKKSLAEIDEQIQKTLLENLPKNIEMRPEVVTQIQDSVKAMIPEIVKETRLAVRQGLGNTWIVNNPWWSRALMVIGLLTLIILLLAILVWHFKNRPKVAEMLQVLGPENKPEKEKATRSGNNLVLTKNVGVNEFNKWLAGVKHDDPNRSIHCFRCSETILAKNMKRHIFERCTNKPLWAKDNKTVPDDHKKQQISP